MDSIGTLHTQQWFDNFGQTMKLNIYQCYYDNSQLGLLSPSFIPYDNAGDKNFRYREYVLWQRFYRKHLNDDSHWGVVSWRWNQKTGLDPKEFIQWIENNPGHDMYYYDPSLETIVHDNLWVQGEPWHPGMINFCNRLLKKMNIDKDITQIRYKAKHFACSSFFVGNGKFWDNYLSFVNEVITYCLFDQHMKRYLFEVSNVYNGKAIPFFSFVIERLFSLYYYLNEDKCNFLKFPVDHSCYKNKFGDHQFLMSVYESKK